MPPQTAKPAPVLTGNGFLKTIGLGGAISLNNNEGSSRRQYLAHLSYSALADLCEGRLGRRDVPCPFCGPGRRAPDNRRRRVLRLWHSQPGFISFYCARCGARGWARQNDDCDRHAAVQPRLRHEDNQDQKRRVEIAIQIWEASIPLHGTRGWRYFTEQRGLPIGDLDDLSHAVRWNEKAHTIIGLMTDLASN